MAGIVKSEKEERFSRKQVLAFIDCPWVFFDDLKEFCLGMLDYIEELKAKEKPYEAETVKSRKGPV